MTERSNLLAILLLVGSCLDVGTLGWLFLGSSSMTRRLHVLRPLRRRAQYRRRFSYTPTTTALSMSGYGVASNYTWKEEAYELDVTVRVPKATRAKDIQFQASRQAVDLRLQNNNDQIVLLDGNRTLKGRVNLDGTYWVISDPDDNDNDEDDDYREVTVTIEKLIKTPKDDFEVIDYDWKGLYKDEGKDEVMARHYDKPEPLDVRQYAASLGVDIDNINMSMVDKTMFSSNLNLTKNTYDELNKQGYLSKEEVTQQADGTEFTINDEGEAVPYSIIDNPSSQQPKTKEPEPIPFLDTDSPWHKNQSPNQSSGNRTVIQQTRNFTRAAFAEDSAKREQSAGQPTTTTASPVDPNADPIDALTVKKLRAILKSQGLKVSGTKKELQDRLRGKVNALLQGNTEEI